MSFFERDNDRNRDRHDDLAGDIAAARHAALSAFEGLRLTDPAFVPRCRTKGCHADPTTLVVTFDESPRPFCSACGHDIIEYESGREYPIDSIENVEREAVFTFWDDSGVGRNYELFDPENDNAWVQAANTYNQEKDAGSTSAVDLAEMV